MDDGRKVTKVEISSHGIFEDMEQDYPGLRIDFRVSKDTDNNIKHFDVEVGSDILLENSTAKERLNYWENNMRLFFPSINVVNLGEYNNGYISHQDKITYNNIPVTMNFRVDARDDYFGGSISYESIDN